jgi:hypothetical protein
LFMAAVRPWLNSSLTSFRQLLANRACPLFINNCNPKCRPFGTRPVSLCLIHLLNYLYPYNDAVDIAISSSGPLLEACIPSCLPPVLSTALQASLSAALILIISPFFSVPIPFVCVVFVNYRVEILLANFTS